jgi:hypothetical protein
MVSARKWLIIEFGVQYENRTRVAAVKGKRLTVIQGNFAAWIALYGTSQTHENRYWTFNGRVNELNEHSRVT